MGERLLIREPGSGTREVLERALEERNLSVGDFPHLTELGSLGAIKSMVMAGAGISFFYEPAVRSEVSSGSLCEIFLEEPPIFHEFSFLWQERERLQFLLPGCLSALSACRRYTACHRGISCQSLFLKTKSPGPPQFQGISHKKGKRLGASLFYD